MKKRKVLRIAWFGEKVNQKNVRTFYPHRRQRKFFLSKIGATSSTLMSNQKVYNIWHQQLDHHEGQHHLYQVLRNISFNSFLITFSDHWMEWIKTWEFSDWVDAKSPYRNLIILSIIGDVATGLEGFSGEGEESNSEWKEIILKAFSIFHMLCCVVFHDIA